MLKIGLLGVGAIGRTIATALDRHEVDATLMALCDQDRARAEALSRDLSSHPPVLPLEEMIERSELAVEAASQAALPEFVSKALARGRDILVMSVGGLLGREEWFRQADRQGRRIYVTSGAIAGLDGVKSASVGKIESAMLTIGPQAGCRSSHGSQFIVERGIQLDQLKEDTVIFRGSGRGSRASFSGHVERSRFHAPGGRSVGARAGSHRRRARGE